MQPQIRLQGCIARLNEIGNSSLTSLVVNLDSREHLSQQRQLIGVYRRLDPQAVPPGRGCREGRLRGLIDGSEKWTRIHGQSNQTVTAGESMERGRTGRTIAARRLDRLLTAVNGQRIVDPKSVWRIDSQPLEDASFAASIAYGPRSPQLTLSPLRIGAILQPADGAAVLKRPEEEFRSVQGKCGMRISE